MKLTRIANKNELFLSQIEWEKIGNEKGWLKNEAKKKATATHPLATCNSTASASKTDVNKKHKTIR